MNTRHFRSALSCRRSEVLSIGVGALLSVLFVAIGGCQNRQVPLSKAAEVLYDSLVTANESMYGLADPNIGFHRRLCLYERAVSGLGRVLATELLRDAVSAVRSRHSGAEWAKVNKGLAGEHPASTPEFCVGVDSLWHARYIGPSNVRRMP